MLVVAVLVPGATAGKPNRSDKRLYNGGAKKRFALGQKFDRIASVVRGRAFPKLSRGVSVSQNPL